MHLQPEPLNGSRARRWMACFVAAALISCGGGDRGTDVPVDPVRVTVAPAQAELMPGATQQFTATVTGASDPRVLWSVMEGPAGGTITDGGLYTAPQSPGTYHVNAAVDAHPGATATTTIVVAAREAPRLRVSPAEATLTPGATQRFDVQSSDPSDLPVTWTVAEGIAGGAVDGAGLYVAPASAGTYHVVATSVADPAVHGTATVTVPLPGLTITPGEASVEIGAVIGFEARLADGQPATVSWSVAEGASGGEMKGYGYFVPPPTPGTYHVLATSLADPDVWGAATVRVVPLVLTLTPAVASVEPGGVLLFKPRLPDGSDAKVLWSVEEGAAGGTVNASGVYTAPLTLGTYHVVATSIWNLTVSVSAEVKVVDAGPNLIDHGGPVFPTARVYAIWWGDPAALADSRVALETFLHELEGSSYLAIADQYLRGAKAHVELGGHYQDSSIPAEAYNADIGPKACEAITNEWKEVDPEGIYFVFTSFLLKGAGGAGWHGYRECNGVTHRLVWVSHSDQFIDFCGGRSGSGAAAVGVFSHELFETMTDGGPGTAWLGQDNREIADKCVRECHMVGSRSWYSNALWSNETQSCEPEALPWIRR